MTRSRLGAELGSLGVKPGSVLMVHTRMSALGWVAGAAETVVHALLDALGPEGTLMAYLSWEHHVYGPDDWPAEHRDAYAADPPRFHPATAESARDHGRVPERIRTWPGAVRSRHPEGGVAAVGSRAGWLTAEQPDDDAYGTRSPFARLVEAGGDVLMLGAPLDTVTLLHHAEAIARVPDKRRRPHTVVLEDGTRCAYADIDTEHGAYPYEELDLDEDEFAVIARAALAAGIGARGRVGAAECHLFPAASLTSFAVAWLEERFGSG